MNILKDKVLRETVSKLAENLGYDVDKKGVLHGELETEDTFISFSSSGFLSSSLDSDRENRIQSNEVARMRYVKDLRIEFNNLNSKLALLIDHLKLEFSEKKGLEIKNKEEVKEVAHHCCHSEDED